MEKTADRKGVTRKAALGAIIGLAGGFLGGLAGLGGGIVMVPLMTFWAKLSQHRAHGTSLVAVVFTGLIGAFAYFSFGTVEWKAAVLLALTASASARFGARCAHSLTEKKLKKTFGYFLILASLLLVAKGHVFGISGIASPWGRMILFLVTGVFSGFVAGMMGVGGGGLMIPPMVVLRGMTQQMAQGTSLLAMVPAGITGALTHHRLGNVAVETAWGLALGAAIGSYAGGTLANLVPEIVLKVIFAALLVWMGLRYVVPHRKSPG